jgi:hypothetical protein
MRTRSQTWRFLRAAALLILGLAAPSVLAAAEGETRLSLAGATVTFHAVKVQGVRGLIGGGACTGGDCEALEALRRASTDGFGPDSFRGGRQLGALICLREKGHSLRALDSHSGEVGVCRFGDGSVVVESSLEQRAVLRATPSPD